MNKYYIRSGLNVVKSTLKVALIIIVLGMATATYAASQADLAGNYYEIGSNQSQHRYLGYFELGEDVQIGIEASVNDNREEYGSRFTDDLMGVVLLHSVSRDFSDSSIIYSLETSELYRDFSADEGYYKLVITNLTNENLGYVIIKAHSSTSMLAVLVFGLVLIGFGFAVVGVTISIVFHILMILGIIFIIRSIMENEQRNRKTPIVATNNGQQKYAGYMPPIRNP